MWIVIQPSRNDPRMLLPSYANVISTETQYQLGEITSAAQWSLDSRWFAVFVIKVGNSQMLQILDTQTGTIHEHPIQPTAALRLVWTSDSAYLVAHDSSTLWIMHDGEIVLEQSVNELRQVQISPDDQSLLLISEGKEEETLELHTMTIVPNQSPRWLMTLPDNYVYVSGFWTIDSQQISYLVETSPPELYVFDVASRQTEFLGTLPEGRWRNRVQVVSADYLKR
jgi:hypothetical protein